MNFNRRFSAGDERRVGIMGEGVKRWIGFDWMGMEWMELYVLIEGFFRVGRCVF